MDDLQTCHQVDYCRSDREESTDEHKEPAANHLLAHFQVGEFLVFILKALLCVLLASKRFDKQDSTDRESLLHHRG